MKFLLFFLGISFFFIFFLFSEIPLREPLFESLFLEAHLYIFTSLVCIISLLRFPSRSSNKNESKTKKIFSKIYISREDILDYIKVFFGQYIYYIGTFLFYISLFLILRWLLWEIDIPFIFLCFNILVVGLYFFQHKFPLFQDLIKVNTLVVSLYYIFQSIEFLLWYSEGFIFIDIINIVFVFILFYFLIHASKTKSYLPLVTSYAFIFSFVVLLCLYAWLFQDVIFGWSILSFIFGIIFLFTTQNVAEILYISKWQVRIWGLVSLYTFTILSPLYLFWEDIISMFFLVLLWATSYILFVFHERFQNYVSLFFSSLSFSFLTFSTYKFLVIERLEQYYFFLFFFFLSWVFILADQLSKNPHTYDKYFFRSFSMLVNVIWVICFLYFVEISILKFAFLLLGECIYFLYSYYSLRNETKLW